jgi:hypothetical protein
MRRLATLTASAALGLGLIAAGAGTAAADPYDCSAWKSGQNGHARCLNGTGEYRVYGSCLGQTQSYPAYGNWARVANLSTFTCSRSSSDRAYHVDLQVR